MAWLAAAGAAGGSGAGAAAAGAAGSAGAAGAGAAGASTAATSAAGAGAAGAAEGASSAIGSTAAEGAAEGAATSGASEGAASTVGSSLKDSLVESGKDMAMNKLEQEANSKNEVQPIKSAFNGSSISSDFNNKSQIQPATFQKNEFKKPEKKGSMVTQLVSGINNFLDDATGMTSSSEKLKTDKTDVSSDSQPKSSVSRFNEAMHNLGEELGAYAKSEGKSLISNAIAGSAQNQPVQPIQTGFTGAQISSDENLKTDIDDAGGIVPLFSTIDSYLYKYKPEAQEEYAGTGMMNNDNNLGVMAQELQENPLTAPAVKKDDKGNLALDTGRLTSINTAMIAELCKKVMELEGQMYGRN